MDGILYGDNKGATAKKVFEKLLRAYFIHLIYFTQYEYECIFATPKSCSSTDKEIKENVEILNNEVENEKFKYFSNSEFAKEIIEKIMKIRDAEKNLSDPFLKCVQLLKLCKVDKNSKQT